MIRASRREAMMGALAVPTLAGLPQWRWQHGEKSVLVHDASLVSGRRFAAAGAARGAKVEALTGDRIRQARRLLADNPALVAGVSLAADALLMEEVAREHGYVRVALFQGAAEGCRAQACAAGWQALGRMAEGAGPNWIEALADYAVKPRGTAQVIATAAAEDAAAEDAAAEDAAAGLGWVLARKG